MFFFPSLLGEQIGLVNDMAVSSSCTVSFFATTMWESVLGTSCPSLKRQKPGGDGFFLYVGLWRLSLVVVGLVIWAEGCPMH